MKPKARPRWSRFTLLAIHVRAALYGRNDSLVERMIAHNFLIDTSRK